MVFISSWAKAKARWLLQHMDSWQCELVGLLHSEGGEGEVSRQMEACLGASHLIMHLHLLCHLFSWERGWGMHYITQTVGESVTFTYPRACYLALRGKGKGKGGYQGNMGRTEKKATHQSKTQSPIF